MISNSNMRPSPPLRRRDFFGDSFSALEASRRDFAASRSSRCSFLSSKIALLAGLPLLMRPYAPRAAPYAVSRLPRRSSSSISRFRYRLLCALRAAAPALPMLSFAAMLATTYAERFLGSIKYTLLAISESGPRSDRPHGGGGRRARRPETTARNLRREAGRRA